MPRSSSPLVGRGPYLLHDLLMEVQGLRGGCYHGYADADIRMLPQAEGNDRQHLAIGLAENLEAGLGQRIGNDTDLDINRRLFEQRDEVLYLSFGIAAPFPACLLRKIELPRKTVDQKATNFGGGDKVDDRRTSFAIGPFALREDRHDPLHILMCLFRVAYSFRHAFVQDLFQMVVE